jgi:hypothetical protein
MEEDNLEKIVLRLEDGDDTYIETPRNWGQVFDL